jgi:pimeloyl-ACP methyl ester carboxylesterase
MRAHAWSHGTVASGGESIYYELTGDESAPVVMLTHGAGGSHAAWFQQVPALVDAGFRTLTWDSRGFGNSTFVSAAHGCDAAVADMQAVLDDANVERVHLVGQSMGGWWVTAFTLAEPARVRSLTLSNTVGGLWTDDLFQHFATLTAVDASEGERLGAHPALSPSFAERDPAHAFLYQQLNTFHTPPMRDIGRALAGTRVEPKQLDATGVVTLVITGSDDQLFPAKLVAQSVARLDNATCVEIAEAGHSPYFERPAEYNRVLLDFLAAHS